MLEVILTCGNCEILFLLQVLLMPAAALQIALQEACLLPTDSSTTHQDRTQSPQGLCGSYHTQL